MPRPLKRKKKTAQPVDVAYPELEEMLATMDHMVTIGLDHKARFFALEARVLQFMKDKGIDTYDRGKFKGTPVYGSTEVIDWDSIREKVGEDVWERILDEPKPSKDKFEALIQIGFIKAADVAEFITDKPSKPYIKLTRRT